MEVLSPVQIKKIIENIVALDPVEEKIWMYIENIFNEYSANNYNLAYQLLSELNSYDDFDAFYEAAIYADNDGEAVEIKPTLARYFTAKHPIARFAKVYIQYLSNDFGEFKSNNTGLTVISSIEPGFIAGNTFKGTLAKDKLFKLGEWLVREKIVEVDKIEDIVKLFSNIPRGEMTSKICWLITNRGGFGNATLFTLLDKVAPQEWGFLPQRNDYISKIVILFTGRNQKILRHDAVRKAYYKWINTTDKNKSKADNLDCISKKIVKFIDGLRAKP